MNIHFFILNLDRNPERYETMLNMLNTLNCSYSRIQAIDGFNMENNENVKKLLKPREHLFGQTFKSWDNGETWQYDGSIQKSFPNLNLNGHHGTKGLTLSNLLAYKKASEMDSDWFCILEDDAEINKNIISNLLLYVQNYNYLDIILLDSRDNGFGGTAGMLYNKRIINQLLEDLHPLSEFSINSGNYKNRNNLWDWKFWTYIEFINTNYSQLPCIDSGKFGSTIDC
jgi:hypothetical protein